jgi:ribose-phosphate pyrophosphokinase
MEIKKYPDGSSYAVVHSQENIIFKINSYNELWHLNQTVDALNNLGIRPTVTLPNLIDAQADRRFNNNESFGLKLVCKFLNSMNADFKIFHPHNSEIVSALLDNVEIIDNSEFIGIVLNHVERGFHNQGFPLSYNYKDETILFSPDAGMYKPLMKLADKLQWRGEVYGASKSRKYEDGKSKLTQVIDRQDFEGKDILIIDDLAIGGSTFKGLSKMLRERNCGKLYLAVSHMTVQNLGEDPVTNYFDKVFTTNSKFDKYVEDNKIDRYGQPQNLEVIKLF